MLLSQLRIHVFNEYGSEISDSSGAVWVYSYPDAALAVGRVSSVGPCPPAVFLLPSGTYQVHAAGHKYLYSSSPYLLSSIVQLASLETKALNLMMSAARKMTISLSNSDGFPIYVQDFKMFWRYDGGIQNISDAIFGATSLVKGDDLFSLPKSKNVYISDTSVDIGLSLTGYSFSAPMWDFMVQNWQHWYEFVRTTSTDFFIECTADQQYFLSWEYHGVSSSSALTLNPVDGQTSIYETKYDIPGAIGSVWCYEGGHRAMGGDAVFYMRKGTFSTLSPLFSGMTKKTIVRGVFSEDYYPGSILASFFERQFYTPDYSSTNTVSNIPGVTLPSRALLIPFVGQSESQRVGTGPFYPSVWTANTNQALVLRHPLLRDQAGASVYGTYFPVLNLFRNGAAFGSYQLPEHSFSPTAQRTISLPGSGSYTAEFDYSPSPQVCNNVNIVLGFSIPSTDPNPPRMTAFEMPQRFAAGSPLGLKFEVVDASSVSVAVYWKPGGSATWNTLSVTNSAKGNYSATIPTTSSTSSVDLKMRLTDAYSNYLEYVAENASLKQVPVQFDLKSSATSVDFTPLPQTITLSGRLTDQSGQPLSATGGVPLELMVNGKKVGMILDEYVTVGAHNHNGTILFPWVFNPTKLFTGAGQTIDVQVSFDLGIYEPIVRTFSLRSGYTTYEPPKSWAVPASGALMAAGASVSLYVSTNESIASSIYNLDGGSSKTLSLAYLGGGIWKADIGTSGWSEGMHSLKTTVTDGQGGSSQNTFSYTIDALSPAITFQNITDGVRIPAGWQVMARVVDTHLVGINYSFDGGGRTYIKASSTDQMFTFGTTALSFGSHRLEVIGYDSVGHSKVASLSFEIVDSTVVVSLLSPMPDEYGLIVVNSGVPIILSVLGEGTITAKWYEYSTWHTLSAPYRIPTGGWSEGVHDIVVNVTNDVGGFAEIVFTLVIDDTPPQISVSCASGTVLDVSSSILVTASDPYFVELAWTVWGTTMTTDMPVVSIGMASAPKDGSYYLNITAKDRAGNENVMAFQFGRDSVAPAMWFSGLGPDRAVAPGAILTAGAIDAFLSMISFSIDGGGIIEIPGSAEIQIDTSSYPAGWHILQLEAKDVTNKSSSLDVMFYVDGTPPVVVENFEDLLEADTAFAASANVTDDFKVQAVALMFELENGSFASIPMVSFGPLYQATLDPAFLWDGMSVAVKAWDSVGNTMESAFVVLHINSTSETTPIPPPLPDETQPIITPEPRNAAGTFTGSPVISSQTVFVALLAIGLAAIAVASSRRSRTERKVPQILLVHEVSNPAASIPISIAAARKSFASALGALESLAKSLEPVAPAVAKNNSKAVLSLDDLDLSFLDMLPAIRRTSAAAPGRSPEPDIDYGEIIERELNLSGLKRSVFARNKEFIGIHEDRDVGGQPEMPQIVSGLRLRRLMRELDDLAHLSGD